MEKGSIFFLAVPPSLKEKIPQRHISGGYSEDGESFALDPSIPIPAELESGETSLDFEKLSWEMILSGMLRIISACGRNNPLRHAAGPKPGIPVKSGDLVSDIEKARIPSEWIEYYRTFVLAVKPEIYHEFTAASIVKTNNEEFDIALEINGALEALFPGSPGILLNRALILESRASALEKKGQSAEKENAEALEAYESAFGMEPVLPDTWFNAGFFFMRRMDFTRARDCFSRYLLAEEESEFSAENSAENSAEFSAGKKAQAQRIIKTIDDQGLEDASFREAYSFVNSGNDEKGLSKIREFIEHHPKVWNGWFVLGWALRKLGRYGDSLEALRKAVELGGGNCETRNEIAICLLELGDLKAAKKELEQALREEPENTKIISNLGVVAQKSGSMEEAAAFFRTVLELDPDDPVAKHYLENQ